MARFIARIVLVLTIVATLAGVCAEPAGAMRRRGSFDMTGMDVQG